jgi:hypothetical protein
MKNKNDFIDSMADNLVSSRFSKIMKTEQNLSKAQEQSLAGLFEKKFSPIPFLCGGKKAS